MAMKPILFNTKMVRKILAGRKTQTRRKCNGLPQDGTVSPIMLGYEPPFHPDDILWVRETWNCLKLGQRGKEETSYWYRADEDEERLNPDDWWRPSIHMPMAAARLFLKVTDVRIERLQDITPMDVKAEGIKIDERDEFDIEASPEAMERFEFEALWNSTIRKADLPFYGWEANPWVWVIEFERIVSP